MWERYQDKHKAGQSPVGVADNKVNKRFLILRIFYESKTKFKYEYKSLPINEAPDGPDRNTEQIQHDEFFLSGLSPVTVTPAH